MKKVILLLCLPFISLCQSIAKIDTGSIQGAAYKILFPPQWDGNLLLYAHGYQFMGSSPVQSKNPAWEEEMEVFLNRGYAVAASDYAHQGLALATGVDDTERLRQYFVRTYGKPSTTIVAGHSMGGGITLATLENFGQFYDGGMPMCPLAGRIYLQTRKELDLIATFNVLFPGYMPSLKELLAFKNENPPVDMRATFSKAMAMQKSLFAKDSLKLVRFAQRFDLKAADVPFALSFGANVLRDVVYKAGGNPYDNTNTLYGRFDDNLYMNQNVERVTATVSQAALFSKYDRTGQIDKPTLALHTIYDQLIPADYAIVPYENLVQQHGKQEFFVVNYTNGQGHCNFTPEQTGRAFDKLLKWIKTGQRPKPEFIK